MRISDSTAYISYLTPDFMFLRFRSSSYRYIIHRYITPIATTILESNATVFTARRIHECSQIFEKFENINILRAG